eukprot:gb/GECH01005728.1/.p1 GENE.gb/GECH01005728.1/~~gb/GECH01005728.1/.p1  ORF type:complete len:118 (+),score=9.81 gb/GECH01005728.1/:1-354(+)
MEPIHTQNSNNIPKPNAKKHTNSIITVLFSPTLESWQGEYLINHMFKVGWVLVIFFVIGVLAILSAPYYVEWWSALLYWIVMLPVAIIILIFFMFGLRLLTEVILSSYNIRKNFNKF